MTSAVETFGLTKRYGSVTAVSDLNLRIEPGQVFGFLGPNGAGKSTTIRMLMALQRPTEGRVSVLGLDARTDTVAVHRRIGYLPGDLELSPGDFTVLISGGLCALAASVAALRKADLN